MRGGAISAYRMGPFLNSEITHLRRENQRLRMEREILKKATAFFARESA